MIISNDPDMIILGCFGESYVEGDALSLATLGTLCHSSLVMKRDHLIVVDMQKDFIDGSLGSAEAVAIVPHVISLVESFDGEVIFTQDTHSSDYLSTAEGRALPVEHCIKGSEGWALESALASYAALQNCRIFEKNSFGSLELASYLAAEKASSVTLCGLCTDICVVSNAILIKSFLPEAEVSVISSCCAGVSVEKHKAALEVMASCQIVIR